MTPNQCTFRYVIISPSEIHFLRFLLEAYDGMGSVTTIDAGLGLVRINTAPGCEEDITRILLAEEKRLRVRSVDVADAGLEPEAADVDRHALESTRRSPVLP